MRFTSSKGKELGSVKLPARQKLSTALVDEEDIEEAVRDALAATFLSLVESSIFADVTSGR